MSFRLRAMPIQQEFPREPPYQPRARLPVEEPGTSVEHNWYEPVAFQPDGIAHRELPRSFEFVEADQVVIVEDQLA